MSEKPVIRKTKRLDRFDQILNPELRQIDLDLIKIEENLLKNVQTGRRYKLFKSKKQAGLGELCELNRRGPFTSKQLENIYQHFLTKFSTKSDNELYSLHFLRQVMVPEAVVGLVALRNNISKEDAELFIMNSPSMDSDTE